MDALHDRGGLEPVVDEAEEELQVTSRKVSREAGAEAGGVAGKVVGGSKPSKPGGIGGEEEGISGGPVALGASGAVPPEDGGDGGGGVSESAPRNFRMCSIADFT
jgi:hypothetical protein